MSPNHPARLAGTLAVALSLAVASPAGLGHAAGAQPPVPDDRPEARRVPVSAPPDPAATAVITKAAANEATIAVLKEQVDRLRDDVHSGTMQLQTVQAKLETLSQTYVPRVEAEQARKLDATPERVASLSARLDAVENRLNGFGDKLIGYALTGGLGIAGGVAAYHFGRKKEPPPGPVLPPDYQYHRRDDVTVRPAPAAPDDLRPPPAVMP